MSFSEKELDPHGEDSAYLALEMAQEFIEEAYPNRKAAIFVQNDGKGGKLHVHALVSNVDSIEYKGCTDEQTKFEYVKENFNRVAGRHITLDNGKKAKDKFSQTERALEEKNEEAAENGGTLEPVWMKELRERIQIAMEDATSEDDFLEALEDEGVKGRYGTSKLNGEYIAYELVDVPPNMEGAKGRCKARSYRMGAAYGVEALREKLREKAKEQLQTMEQRNNATERRAVMPDIPQRGLSMEAAAWPPMNETPEMTYVPARKPVDVQTVRDTINAIISGPRREAETPIPVQPAPTMPPTAAEGDGGADSTPEGKQPAQSVTAPRKRHEGARQRMREMYEKEKQKQAENQHDDMEWLSR